MPRRRRLLLQVSGLGVVVVTAIAIVAISASGTSNLTSGDVSILARPVTTADRLPASVLDSPLADQFANHGDGARLSQTSAEAEVFVVPGQDGSLCLVVAWSDATATNCGDPAALDNAAIYLARPVPNGQMDVWGIVANSVLTVGGMNATNNTFTFHGAESRALPLVTTDGTRELVIGSLEPPT